MKAADITLSAVGAGGGGADEFLEQPRGAGRRPLLARPPTPPRSPTSSSRRRSRRPASRSSRSPSSRSRPATSPILRRHGGRACRSCSATTARRSSPRPQGGPGDRPRRPAPGPVAVRPGSVGGLDQSTRPGAGQPTGSAGTGFNRFFSQLVALDLPGRGVRRHGGRVRGRRRRRRDCGCARPRATARRATSTRRRCASSPGPRARRSVQLDQVAPGIYEAPLGMLEPGAYALRIDQTRAGRGRPGADRGAGRADPRRVPAAGHQRSAADDAARRDRRAGRSRRPRRPGPTTCARPPSPPTSGRWLLLLALLLWPIDVAVRRVSVSRRELAAARRLVRLPGARARSGGPTRSGRRHAGGQGARGRDAVTGRAGQAAGWSC